MGGVDREAVEHHDIEGNAGMRGNRGRDLAQQADPLRGFDQRLLAMMRADPQHQAVANAGDAGNDVEMAESDGIEASR